MMIESTDSFAMMPESKYKFVQEFGQRKYGPPEGWNGPPPPKGCEIFIGKLPRDMPEDELMQLFELIGPIYEFRLMVDFSGSNRGFAYATYTNKRDAKSAISKLDRYEVRPGRRIGVLMSVDNCKLYVGGIPVNKSEDEVYREISRVTEGVLKVSVFPHSLDRTKNRGYAFVEYESHRYALIARRVLLSGEVKLFNRMMDSRSVDWADPEPDEENLKETTTLYVRNIPQQIDESCLMSIFSANGLGPVRKIRKLKDFAFVHYFSKKDAEKALNQLNGTNLSGHVLEITWAKPKVQVSEGCYSIQKKSIMKKESEDWSISQESPKHVVPQAFFPTINSIHNTPVQILDYVCLQSGFGEPYYLIYQSVSREILTFTSKVFIPYLPLWENSFVSDGGLPSPFEAKCFAAMKALKYIGFSDIDYHFFGDPFIPAIKHSSCRSIASVSHSSPTNTLNIGQESRHCHELEDPFIPAIKQSSCPNCTSIPRFCPPITLDDGQESRQCHELVKASSSSYSDVWNFSKENEIISNKKSDFVSIYDLLPAAAVLAYQELEACSSKQK